MSFIGYADANLALERASASVETKIEGDNSFEVSFLLGENAQCTVDDVVEVISNTDLLNLWCNPIETLIVTSNSSEGSSFTRSLDETSSTKVRLHLFKIGTAGFKCSTS